MIQKFGMITRLLVQTQGVDVSKYNITFLDRAIEKRMIENGCETANAYIFLLEHSNTEIKILLNSLNINYSEFFRNPFTFSVLEHLILPSLNLKNGENKLKEIRVWSAACASGQEAYSLAILLEELNINKYVKSNYRIFATDQSELHLNEARIGQYSSVSLDNLNLKRINKWFSKKDDTYTLNSELKRNIDFSVFDLLNENHCNPPSSIYGDFDLVVCANLLFYYRPLYQKKILEKASESLSNRGFLITGETERDILLSHKFREVYPYSAIFQR